MLGNRAGKDELSTAAAGLKAFKLALLFFLPLRSPCLALIGSLIIFLDCVGPTS